MAIKTPLKGSIVVFDEKSHESKFSFNIDLAQGPSFAMTLLTNFKNLPDQTKKDLTRDMRQELAAIQQIPQDTLYQWGLKFCQFLNDQSGLEIQIKASGSGGHICLAALLCGQLARHKRYSFHLSGSPLCIFPQNTKLWKAPTHLEHTVVLGPSRDQSGEALASLYQCPKIKGLHLSYNIPATTSGHKVQQRRKAA